MTALANMPAARRRIWEAGLKAKASDPEAGGRLALAEQERARALAAAGLGGMRRAPERPSAPTRASAQVERNAADEVLRAGRAIGKFGVVRFTAAQLAVICQPILAEVASKHRVGLGDILSHARPAPLVRARQEAMARLKAEAGLSYCEIGVRFGRDHSTILYGVRAHVARHGLPELGQGSDASQHLEPRR